VHRFQVELAKSYREVAFPQHFTGRDADALESLDRSKALLEALVKNDSGRALYHNQLGRTLNNIGYIHDERRDNREALGPFQDAVAEHRRAVAESVDAHEYKYFLAISLGNLGEQYVDLGDPVAGLPYFEEALRARRELLGVNPGNAVYRNEVVEGLLGLASLRRQLGDPATAREEFAEAARLLESAASDSSARCELGDVLVREAGCLSDQGEQEKAEAVLERVASRMREERKAALADEPATRRVLSESLRELARVRRLRGRVDASDRATAERRSLWDRSSRDGLVALASQSAARAGLVGYGRSPLPPRGEAVRELYVAAAAADLRLAWELGFRDGPRILADRNLADVLDRAPLRALRDDLDFPEQPFANP
jgi:tetratricopeptide (TPR) repeat protein